MMYVAELTNPGSDDIKSYDFALTFWAKNDEEAIDTVSNILNGSGIIQPPAGTRFQLYRLIQTGKGSDRLVLE